MIKEYHMTVTEEPKGRYLTHYTPDTATEEKPAKQCLMELFDWMKDRRIDACLEVIGSDTTNELSGGKVACFILLRSSLIEGCLCHFAAFK